MDLDKAVNISNYGLDLVTGKQLSYAEVCRRKIEFLGGLDDVAKYIPFSIQEIRDAIKEDMFLNNLTINNWEAAAGFEYRLGDYKPTFRGLWFLYRQHGINTACCAEGVCILKEAARMLAKRYD